MATDKRLDQVSQLTDFDYALIVKGTDVAKVTKQQFAELVGNFLYGATTKETLASVVAGQMGILKTKSYSTESGSTITTDINVNAGYFGGTIFAVESSHSSGGNSTASEFKMIRCGYSENYIETTTIASLVSNANNGLTLTTYSVNGDGYLVIEASVRILRVNLFML